MKDAVAGGANRQRQRQQQLPGRSFIPLPFPGQPSCILNIQLVRTVCVQWWTTYRAQRTREMLNILINWLRDHTLWQQSCRTHLSQRRSITSPARPSCCLSLMSSSPFSFSTSFHQHALFRRWNDRQYPCLTCHTRLCHSRRSWAPQKDRHPICRNRCSPLTRRIRVVSAGIKINRSSCPQIKRRLGFCWMDYFCEEITAL